MIHAVDGTEVLSVYEEDYVKGMPVVTAAAYGKGKAYYIAAEPEQRFLSAFYADRFREADLVNPLGVELPYGVTVTARNGEDGKQIVFVMNFRNEPVRVDGIGTWTDVENGTIYTDSLEMGSFGCVLLRRQI